MQIMRLNVSRRISVKKLASWALIISGFSIFFYYGSYLDNFYYRTAPRQPDVPNGRVIEKYVHHGAKVYLTEEENAVSRGMPFVGILIAFAGGLLYSYWKLGGNVILSADGVTYIPVEEKKE
jgi:hypothetical protein